MCIVSPVPLCLLYRLSTNTMETKLLAKNNKDGSPGKTTLITVSMDNSLSRSRKWSLESNSLSKNRYEENVSIEYKNMIS